MFPDCKTADHILQVEFPMGFYTRILQTLLNKGLCKNLGKVYIYGVKKSRKGVYSLLVKSRKGEHEKKDVNFPFLNYAQMLFL